ncbi:hypothetical protein [Peptostreptococcus porci]|uniref:hypothetical protein n=1 Tax=Peptostreptococcus porci TaxID=2652282 RepID=UPI002A80C069|nr:hypothetical protein [Peptostreptococcus porci]MDY4128697.1 hypothetical protein [Peptostreptococcus porci]
MIEVLDDIKNIGIPVAYGKFESTQKPPFIVYFGSGESTFLADNTQYYSEDNYVLEYYYTRKSRKKEKELEQIFKEHEIMYDKTDDIYIDSEKIYLIKYYI